MPADQCSQRQLVLNVLADFFPASLRQGFDLNLNVLNTVFEEHSHTNSRI